MTVVGMIGDGEEFWIHHNLYYHLIFKFIGNRNMGGDSVIFD